MIPSADSSLNLFSYFISTFATLPSLILSMYSFTTLFTYPVRPPYILCYFNRILTPLACYSIWTVDTTVLGRKWEGVES